MTRRLKKKYRRFLNLFLTAAVLLLAGALFLFIPKPPDEEMERTRVSIGEARKLISPDFVPPTLTEAEILYDSAMRIWKQENEKFIFSRNYKSIINLCTTASQLAVASPKLADQAASSFIDILGDDIKTLKADTTEIGLLYRRLPALVEINGKYTQGVLLLKEAELNLEQKKYKESRKKLDEAKNYVGQVTQHVRFLLNNYFSKVPQWQQQASQTIRQSSTNQSYAIIVDKFATECYLYKNGRLSKTFKAELGKNWIGDKQFAGDKATPEGLYKITRKKQGGQTKYYKALLLNYPNDEDKKRFKEAIRNQSIPSSSQIGGLIEIHGGGGKGIHWTDGCVALENRDMDMLYRLVPVGCPVLIVGSLHSLDEVQKKARP
ncbi:MAG: L,D-transpeptidase [Bacteroidales bacterium]|nr:L,D-transpeptidase [Bacteroidales bacterium]MDD2570726.1 L,D-transpeptidase [Bacteroidales bacterium]MDD3812736.1 L,D-transpeptidase [Bacteroidales bacterium]MDD3871496.1 L,D-transpeptidase [Bacteroidales bacterium]MDD4812702.1 L,D-transpeptidase [Bacteroidales bacterium]